ncbi:hypothetical protein [Mesorhizobium sp. WSM3862]|uniref:hypothetical protein n=1 Tax=Mesorhizobium sp. WSM3862 TaxID=632858 RepID=UPI000BAF6DCE|nr:hypothetical protein [Mesorhizobium sp. WSM3862]PBB95668.1 hypothetical protein CK224_25840 [Mesorhizobium sp. WSM3862]
MSVRFSGREHVRYENRSSPLSGNRPQASEGWIGARPIEIVGILITAGDGEDTDAQNVGHGVRYARSIQWIVDRKPVDQSHRPPEA